jgi:hypothetical protein
LTSIQPYDIGCEPSPSVPAETVIADGWCTYLLFFAVSKMLNANGKLDDLRVAVLRCNHCVSSRFGYPNGEGFPEHPLYDLGLDNSESSVLRIVDSTWTRDVQSQMAASARRIWGARVAESTPVELHHFLIALKEATFECVAESMTVETYAETFDAAFAHVMKKLAEH